ncbi:MAG: hypothetical protein Q7J68_08525 [Thermoplasmata archaeon]|nr:hypothetical protein [Thermoplasmata archaeon]
MNDNVGFGVHAVSHETRIGLNTSECPNNDAINMNFEGSDITPGYGNDLMLGHENITAYQTLPGNQTFQTDLKANEEISLDQSQLSGEKNMGDFIALIIVIIGSLMLWLPYFDWLYNLKIHESRKTIFSPRTVSSTS